MAAKGPQHESRLFLERIGPTCTRQSRRMQVALATPKRFGISNDERQLGERARSYARTSYPLLKRLIAVDRAASQHTSPLLNVALG